MTNREMLAALFSNDDIDEDYLSEYIDCPDVKNCEYEKPNATHSVCDSCKIKWLRDEMDNQY